MSRCYHIIGCGTIGYPLSERLLSMFPDMKIHLWDDDFVELGINE